MFLSSSPSPVLLSSITQTLVKIIINSTSRPSWTHTFPFYTHVNPRGENSEEAVATRPEDDELHFVLSAKPNHVGPKQRGFKCSKSLLKRKIWHSLHNLKPKHDWHWSNMSCPSERSDLENDYLREHRIFLKVNIFYNLYYPVLNSIKSNLIIYP